MKFRIVLSGDDELRHATIKGPAGSCMAALTGAMAEVLYRMDGTREAKLRQLADSTRLIAEAATGRRYRCKIEEVEE